MTNSYEGGYTKALIDVVNWFENHSIAMRYNKLYNRQCVEKLLNALLENRAELRETGDVNLVWSKEKKVFLHAKDC